MKKLEAIVEPSEVEDVKKGLTKIGLQEITVGEVKVFGRQAGTEEIYRGMRYEAPYQIGARIEMIVPDGMAHAAVTVIRETIGMYEASGTRIVVSSLEDIEGLPTENKRVAAA